MRLDRATCAKRLHLLACLGLAIALLPPAWGCAKAGGKKKPRTAVSKPEGTAEADATDAVSATDVPALAKTEPDDESAEPPEGIDPTTALNVDRGRLTVMSPAGWIRASQSKDYVVKYVPSRQKTYPSIVVMAADAPAGLTEIDADNQREFVAAIAESLAATFTKNGKSTLIKKPAPVRLGEYHGATWAAPATIKVAGVSESIDRTSYAVVIGGRMYTIEVRAPKGKLDAAGRAAARAVAAALAPVAAAASPDAAAPTEEAPAADAAK